jgi:3-phosphoshikimate 1-carboxyvinyltransferase
VTTLTFHPAQRLTGRIRVPGDKSISHRGLLMAARAEGRSTLRGLSQGLDVRCTLKAVEAFGATVTETSDVVLVDGGAALMREPASVIDVGNSGTAIRLMAGWAASVDGLTVLAGDESVARRPMDRVVEPLRKMGARIDGRDGGRLAPLVLRGGDIHGIDYTPAVPSAQVKGAVLLAALGALGATTVREATPTRLHTEEMLRRFGADVETGPGWVRVAPGQLQPLDLDVPGDPSQAAFWVVAACVTPGSDVTVQDVYVGPARAGFVDVLLRMGAEIEMVGHDRNANTASIRARYGPLVATDVSGTEVPGLIDEIPVLAVAAAHAQGVTTFSDAAELRIKESDRVATTVESLRSLGVDATGRADGLVVEGRGGRPLHGGHVESQGDHRIAMAAAVAALAADSAVTVAGWESVATSYPGFEQDMARCAS